MNECVLVSVLQLEKPATQDAPSEMLWFHAGVKSHILFISKHKPYETSL